MSNHIFKGLVVTLSVAFIGYLILSIYIVPNYASCSQADQIPQNPTIDISLNQWVVGNILSGGTLFLFLAAFCKECSGNNNCLVYFFLIITIVYILFQTVWSIIGFIIFNSFYEELCLQADNFNTIITAELIYGIILFPLIIITVFWYLLKDICCSCTCPIRKNKNDSLNGGINQIEKRLKEDETEQNIIKQGKVEKGTQQIKDQAIASPSSQNNLIINQVDYRNSNIYQQIYYRLSSSDAERKSKTIN